MKRIALLLPSVCLLASVTVAQWSTPALLANVNSSVADEHASPTFDGLTLYLSSSRNGGNFEIFRATRTAPYAAFGVASLIPELADPGADNAPCVRIDDLEIFFQTTRSGGGGGIDIWRAERASTSVPFNAPVPVLELNSTAIDGNPSLTADGLRIYFTTTRPGSAGSFDIWTATRPNWTSPFGMPTPVAELNTTAVEYGPHISSDGLTIFFSSTRAGGMGEDLWVASRLDLVSPFANIANPSVLNSASGDTEPCFALFHDEVFFSSNRAGGLGSYEIYSSRFTGLIGVGLAGAGSSQDLRFSDPPSAGLPYVAASSLGSTPGIPIDTRVLPLNFDVLLQLSIGGLPPILTGYVGVLNQDGIGAGRISFAGFPTFGGLRFFSAFVVLDPAAPSGIRTISNPHEVQVHP